MDELNNKDDYTSRIMAREELEELTEKMKEITKALSCDIAEKLTPRNKFIMLQIACNGNKDLANIMKKDNYYSIYENSKIDFSIIESLRMWAFSIINSDVSKMVTNTLLEQFKKKP